MQKIDLSIAVINYFDTVSASAKAFNEGLTADLIFMDIHLADGNSFEIFSQVKLEIPVIFTTAYPQYALEGFEVNALDYLVKPISFDRFLKAAMKAKEYYELRQQNKAAEALGVIAGVLLAPGFLSSTNGTQAPAFEKPKPRKQKS